MWLEMMPVSLWERGIPLHDSVLKSPAWPWDVNSTTECSFGLSCTLQPSALVSD